MVARTIKADPERVQNSGAAQDIGTYVKLIERLPEPRDAVRSAWDHRGDESRRIGAS